MVLLGVVLRICPKLVLPLGLFLLLGHDYIELHTAATKNQFSAMAKVLFNGTYVVPLGNQHAIAFLYAILPWTAVLFLGYSMGRWIEDRRKGPVSLFTPASAAKPTTAMRGASSETASSGPIRAALEHPGIRTRRLSTSEANKPGMSLRFIRIT